MVQNLSEGRKETQRVERKTQKKLAQRRLRKNGAGHAVREKELAIALIDAAMSRQPARVVGLLATTPTVEPSMRAKPVRMFCA